MKTIKSLAAGQGQEWLEAGTAPEAPRGSKSQKWSRPRVRTFAVPAYTERNYGSGSDGGTYSNWHHS
jgi:hypothetical protein